MSSLNPVLTCGQQVVEAIRLHQRTDRTTARLEALTLFEKVRLPDAARIFRAYPHQLSGGQKQRVMIAMALSSRPNLLIADEPTTALDVTVQKEILELLQELRTTFQLAVLFISHDLGLIQHIADRVLVMKEGVIVESGPTEQIFQHPQHPYTRGLLACRPVVNLGASRLPTVAQFENDTSGSRTSARTSERLPPAARSYLRVENLSVWYPTRRNFVGTAATWIKAVDELNLTVRRGETFGLVGESGCGKSTLGRTLVGLESPRAGRLWLENTELTTQSADAWRDVRRRVQMIFQDPYSSLNPAQPVGLAIEEPMRVHRLWKNAQQYRAQTVALLEKVGLEADHYWRFPHEFSGGQRQRIGIARALSVQPECIICDECVSALDVSVQAQIINLLLDLQAELHLTYLFISHDLSVVRFVSDRIGVMHRGRLVELNDAEALYTSPQTAYAQKLLAASS